MSNSSAIVITTPQTKQHWQHYYQLRWQLLRKPWQQAKGSERDELEALAYHRMAIKNGQLIGVGRIHVIDSDTAQIRYMAVHADYRQQSTGSLLLNALEQTVKEQGVKKVILHSRELACGFYLKRGYVVVEPSHVLYGLIPHYLMEKVL